MEENYIFEGRTINRPASRAAMVQGGFFVLVKYYEGGQDVAGRIPITDYDTMFRFLHGEDVDVLPERKDDSDR